MRILKRTGLLILSILLFFIPRSRALADMAWEPAPGSEGAAISPRHLMLIFLICIIGSVWLWAKARMLNSCGGNGWDVLIPFCGRYQEYKYYWGGEYYFINFVVLFFTFVLAIFSLRYEIFRILMYAGLLVWGMITVLMRMKTMEAFGLNKFLGLLELLGLCIVLDLLCAYSSIRAETERNQKADPLIGHIKPKLPVWIRILLALMPVILGYFLYQDFHMYLQTVSGYRVGEIIKLGSYEQDGLSGADAIEWKVLGFEDGRALLLSRYALEAKPFHDSDGSVTWEESSLRAWLNGSFYDSAFSDSEKARIHEVLNSNPDNPVSGTASGNDTQDKIFLLSISEVEQYLPRDFFRRCSATDHAKENGVDIRVYADKSNGNIRWWLRSQGFSAENISIVTPYGIIFRKGYSANDDSIAVRPALWLDL